MKEIGLHGRGGQGIVMAGEILANAYFHEGNFAQFMPSYGAERRGSPSNAYIRVSKTKIYNRYAVVRPDAVIVFNMSLIDLVKVKDSGIVLLNIGSGIEKDDSDAKIFAVDANYIALSLKLGTSAIPIINTALLGAFCKIMGDYSFDHLSEAIKEKLGKNADKNIEAAKIAYDSVRKL